MISSCGMRGRLAGEKRPKQAIVWPGVGLAQKAALGEGKGAVYHLWMHELRERWDGQTVAEWRESNLEILKNDAVGLYSVIGVVEDGFGLSGAAADELIRAVFLDLLRAGGRPVRVVADVASHSGKRWIRDERYGNVPDDIADTLINELKALGRDPDPGDGWLVLPANLQTPLVY